MPAPAEPLMKIAPRGLGRFLRTAEASVAAVLFYGPDQGLVRERGGRAHHPPGGRRPRSLPRRRADAGAAEGGSGPPRRRGRGLVADRRPARPPAARGRRRADPALSELLAETTPAAFLVLEAGELGPRSSLRGLFERATQAAAIACYLDDEGALQQVIADWLKIAWPDGGSRRAGLPHVAPGRRPGHHPAAGSWRSWRSMSGRGPSG